MGAASPFFYGTAVGSQPILCYVLTMRELAEIMSDEELF
jgi:hypothetical protein